MFNMTNALHTTLGFPPPHSVNNDLFYDIQQKSYISSAEILLYQKVMSLEKVFPLMKGIKYALLGQVLSKCHKFKEVAVG
jgi:hypothetical protein